MTSTIQRFEPSQRPAVSQATAIEQSRAVAEVQAAVIVAQNVPRDIQRAMAEMRQSCGLLAMASQAFYQVPNRGTGPSVHLARELARIWGNIEHGSQELRRDDEASVSEVQGFAWDKQTNTRTSRTFIAPHERMKAGSRQRLTDLGDIQNNNNSVAARATRECILNVLPRWFIEEAQTICRRTLEHGEGKPLPQRIEEMVNVFKGIGVGEKQIEAKLEKKRGQWDAGDVAQMGIVYTSITRDGISRDDVFPPLDETVADLVSTDELDKPSAKGASKLSGKVKPAGSEVDDSRPAASENRPEPDTEQVSDTEPKARKSRAARNSERNAERAALESEVAAAAAAADQAEGNNITTPAEAMVDFPAQPGEPAWDQRGATDPAPGAPTEETPGQTDRVEAALRKAHNTSKAREALLDLITALFRECGYDSLSDLPTVASSILKLQVKDADKLTDSQLKTVHNSLNSWQTVGTLAEMVDRILDAADMQAEQQTGQQQTDTSN
jgi:hypothetical protein